MKRNSLWFWLFLVALLVVVYVGTQYIRGESVCGRDAPKTWAWDPPRWECGR